MNATIVGRAFAPARSDRYLQRVMRTFFLLSFSLALFTTGCTLQAEPQAPPPEDTEAEEATRAQEEEPGAVAPMHLQLRYDD